MQLVADNERAWHRAARCRAMAHREEVARLLAEPVAFRKVAGKALYITDLPA